MRRPGRPAGRVVAAWIGGFSGASKHQTDRSLAAAQDQAWEGVLPWMAQGALGQARYLSGQAAEARAPLEALVQRVSPIDQPYAVVDALAVLALLAGDQDDDQTATALAARAAETAKAQGLTTEPLSGIAHLALGRALLRQGKLAEAQEELEWARELFGIDAMAVHRAHGLLSGRPRPVVRPRARAVSGGGPISASFPARSTPARRRAGVQAGQQARRDRGGISWLTAIERRLLPLLATHLRSRRLTIGERL
jgi:tetratricopeptide (TPR) repeat protein